MKRLAPFLVVAGFGGCSPAPTASGAHHATECPRIAPAPAELCAVDDCPPTLCHALHRVEGQGCRHAQVILRATCADRIELVVAHGLASEIYYYDRGNGRLVGSASENDTLEGRELGRADSNDCGEPCLLCGRANTPTRACSD